METRVHAGLTPAEGRRFALQVGFAFLALAALLVWRDHRIFAAALAACGALLLAAGIIAPGRLGGVYRAWMALAHAISRVTTPVFMAVVYFLVMTPVGVLRRRIGANPLVHRLDNDGYWKTRAPGAARKSRLTRQF